MGNSHIVCFGASFALSFGKSSTILLTAISNGRENGFFPLMADLRVRCVEAAASSHIRGMVFTCAFAFPEADQFATRIESILKRNGGKHDLVRLTCASEDLEKRVSNTDRKKFGKIAEPSKLKSTIERFDLLNVLAGKEALSVDTSAMSPEEASSLICEKLT